MNNPAVLQAVVEPILSDWLVDDLAERKQSGLYRRRRWLQSGPGVHVRWRGQAYLNFASNDYLNLAADPRLAAAAARAARKYGCGSGASPLITGYLPPQRALERALADWEGTQAALLFSSGFAANLAVVSSLAGRDDVIFSDALNHASLIDGCRLSRAAVHIYRHRDVDHLHELLSCQGGRARRRLIVTETVFSMDGDVAPLSELCELARAHDCLLIIDEAHATGVLGVEGQGLTHDLPAGVVEAERLIKVGTLSKALGSQGGFVCGSRRLVDWLVNHARPYIFSTALAPPLAAAARRALAIVRAEPERRKHVLAMTDQLRAALGQPVGDQFRCPIVPIMIGDSKKTCERSARLESAGLLVPAIRPPTVPDGTARLRISVTTGHSEADIRRLVEALG